MLNLDPYLSIQFCSNRWIELALVLGYEGTKFILSQNYNSVLKHFAVVDLTFFDLSVLLW